MVEKSDVVEECSSCVRLKQEIEIARKDHAATLKMIKEKIMSTDKLIKKYQKKCDDFDKQAKQLNDLTSKHENCERNSEILQEQLSHSLEVTEPQKKTIKRLIQEKFVAEETIQESKKKIAELQEVINHLKHGIELRDEKDSSWKLEQQLLAKQIEKEKQRAEKLMKDLEKAKEEIKKGKVLVREQNRGLRAFERKCDNLGLQVIRLKEELKCTKKNAGFLREAKRKLSPKETYMTRSTRQRLKRCEENLDELLSDARTECKSTAADETPALASIFDEMTNIADCPLSPVPASPTESRDSSSESSDDHSSDSDTDSDGGSLGDLGDILELNLKNNDAKSLEDGTVENSSLDGDVGGGLETESEDEDTENNNESVSAANDDENPENNEQIIEKRSDKETIHDSEKEQNSPEERQHEEQGQKTNVSEDIDAKCISTLSGTTVISSDEVTNVATSKETSEISTQDSTNEKMDTNESTLEVIDSETTSPNDKVSCESLDKETIEEVDIQNNNLSLSRLNKDLKDSLSASVVSENGDMAKNEGMSTTSIPNHVRTQPAQGEDSTMNDIDDGAMHETFGDKLLSSENIVKGLDLDKSEDNLDELQDGGGDEFADPGTTVLPGKRDDELNNTHDNPVTRTIQPAKNDALLSDEKKNTSKLTEYASKSVESELYDDDKDDSLPNDAEITENIQHAENEALLSAENKNTSKLTECASKSVESELYDDDKDDSLPNAEITENIQHAENDAHLSAENKNTLKDSECASKSMENELNDDDKEDSLPNDDKITENIQHAENDLSAENKNASQHDEYASKSMEKELNDDDKDDSLPNDAKITENLQHAENDALLSAENKNASQHNEYASKSIEKELNDDDKDDSLPNNDKIIRDSLKNIEVRLEDILPEHQKQKLECTNKVDDENVGLLDKNQDKVSDEEKPSSKRTRAHSKLTEKIRTRSQTSKDTKSHEKSLTPSKNNNESGKISNEVKTSELKNDVVRSNRRTKRNNPEQSFVRRKRQKRGVTPEVVATPDVVNRTPQETVVDNLEGTQTEDDQNQSAAETRVDEKVTVSTSILEHDSIDSNDENRDDKSSKTDNSAKKSHLGLTDVSSASELQNEEENGASEESKVESVDNKAVLCSSDLTKSYNKVECDLPCDGVSSITVMEEGTEEVLEEGGNEAVLGTNANVFHVAHDALEHQNDKTILDFEAFDLVDVVDSNLNEQDNPVDDTHQSDFTTIQESIDAWDKMKSKSSASDPSIPSLSSVLNDSFHVFDEEMPPLLAPLPPSPCSSRQASPAPECNTQEHTPSLFTSLPTLGALKPLFHATSLVGASGVSSASSVSQASFAIKRHGPPAEYKDLEPTKKSKRPKQDTFDDLLRKQVKELKVNKQMTKKLSVRPSFLTEAMYVDKVLRLLTQEHANVDEVVCRLSNTKTMSSDIPIATTLAKFKHSEDLMPIIIQKYHARDRQHQEQSSRLAHLKNWVPVLSVYEERVSLVVTRLAQVEHLKGLPEKVISLLSSAIIQSCLAAEEPDKRCVASHCRLVCALCRSESSLQRMRVLCYDIIRCLYSRPGTVLYLMISIAAVWPAVLVSAAPVSSKGFVCLAGESYLPLPCTIQMVLTTWVRTHDWVLLGNVLDWLCAWKQVPSGVLSLEQLAGELVQMMKDPSSAQLMHGKDGNPVLGFGLYEAIKSLELISCVLGWVWLNNVLCREYLWDILTRWINKIQPDIISSDAMTPCPDSEVLSRSASQHEETQLRNSDAADTSSTIDVVQKDGSESLSTFVNQNKEDQQRTNHGNGDTSGSIDVMQKDGSESLSASAKDDKQRTNHGSGDTSSSIDVVQNDISESLSTSVNQNKEDQQRTNHGSTADTSSSIDVMQKDDGECLSTSVNQNKEERLRNAAGITSRSVGVVDNDARVSTNDQVPEPTVVAAIRLLGLVCKVAVQHHQKIPPVISLLVGLLQTTRDCQVPYAVQLASAYSLLEVSPWQPSRVVSVLEEWKAMQDSKSKTLPVSLIQGLNSLRTCLERGKDVSGLSEGYTRMLEDNDDENI